MSIGSVFHDSYQYTEFSRVSKIALNNAYKLNSPIENVISLYTHVATSYYNLEEYDSSKVYYNKILDGFDEMGYSINVVKKDLVSNFKKNGIEAIDCINKKFDPNFHQAMLEIENSTQEPGTIIQEIQKGYMMKNRLLRPSLVGVAKKTLEKADKK